jgi:hypothetical protein
MTLTTSLVNPLTYQEYRILIDRLIGEGKTTGGDQTEATLDYAKLNVQRMTRLDLMAEVTQDLKHAMHGITHAQTWLVITEGWCGDAAQTVPILAKAAQLSDRVTLRFILRDENPDVMDQFLTNGTRSIPIVVIADDASREVLGVWGPRPEPAKELVAEFKKDPGWNKEFMLMALHTWYAKDRTVSAQTELACMLVRIEEDRQANH